MIRKSKSVLKKKDEQEKNRLHPSSKHSDFRAIKAYPLTDRPDNSHAVHLDIIVALSPLIAWSVYLYGLRPITIALISAVMTLGLDIAARTVLKKDRSFDLSPVITGLITALCLPPSSPLWLPVFTSAIAAAVRNLSFGTRRSILDPSAAAILLSFISFPKIMSAIPATGAKLDPFSFSVSGYEGIGADALETVLAGFLPEESLWELLFGLRGGMIGEMSALLLIGGALYLCIRRIYKPLLPAVYLLSIAVISYFFPSLAAASDTLALKGALYNVLGMNTMLCAIYMASAPVTTPRSPIGTVIAGIVGGAVTIVVRYYLSAGASALCGIITVNLLSLFIDSFFKRTPFGGWITPDTEGVNN